MKRKTKRAPKRLQRIRGQISLMIVVMMMTFILLFAFVINTGMLVNAKINLQNAADLAAVAGASVQARQLNSISYLNYEMRRQWKKFLFRIYVIGNMAQDEFPNQPADGKMTYQPNEHSPQTYGVPTTCVIFNPSDNYCHLDQLPAIPYQDLPDSPLDAITSTLKGQLQAIEQIRQNNCKAIGITNIMLNVYWLFNTDPQMTQFKGANSHLSDVQKNALTIIQGLAQGLGIVPRELILKMRIDTLASYVNSPAQLGLTHDQVENVLKKSTLDPSTFERSILAFNSGYYTLGNHTFASDSITMDELLPTQILQLKPIDQNFDTYAIDLDLGGNMGTPASTNASPCNARIIPVSVKNRLIVGVYKDPTVLTYYALRFRAKANLLFSPFGPLEIKAYAAAKPFGSRIGPSFATFTTTATPASGLLPSPSQQGSPPTLQLPNLPVREGESSTPGSGWDTKRMLGTLYSELVSAGGGPSSNSISTDDLERAYHLAMMPNPWEVKKYNIINDLGQDPFIKNFGADNLAAIWAPIVPAEKRGTVADEIKSRLMNLFNSEIGGNIGTNTSSIANIQSTLEEGITHYASTHLQAGTGENGEGINVVRITNPFQRSLSGTAPSTPRDPNLFVLSPLDIKTSWNAVKSGDYRNQGRVGYSVKFISFASLTSQKLTTDGQSNWNNAPGFDEEANLDIPFIEH